MSEATGQLYFAAPLFSMAELEFNARVEKLLAPYFQVFLPQRDGGLMDSMVRKGMKPEEASRKVFEMDIDAIRSSDVVLAVLDGRSIDEGVSVELGFAFALNKPCYGMQTGPRRLLPSGNNPMIENVLISTFSTILSLEQWAQTWPQGIIGQQPLSA